MTNQEAIALLNQEEIALVLNGKKNTNLLEAHLLAIEALEKHRPKKPTEIDRDCNYFVCPSCGEAIYSTEHLESHKYCLECGQAISWEVE